MSFKAIGTSKPLIEGREKVTGTTRYVADIKLPGTLEARFVPSMYAHANILNIDASAALEVSGVVAVLTQADMPDIPPDSRDKLLLARGRVMFVGQPVALVFAETEEAAADGADLVFVEYEPLPAVVMIDEAMAPDAPLVWPTGKPGDTGEAAAHGAAVSEKDDSDKAPSNISDENTFKRGDIAAGFAAADAIVEHSFTTPIVHHSYLEPQATLVQPDPYTGGATVWSSTQAPFPVREIVAEIFGVSESDVRVIATPVGGGFGGKFVLYQPLVAAAAKAINRPVRLVLTRGEEMMAANPAPAAQFTLKLGGTKEGQLTALEADVKFDAGCYPSFHGVAAFLMGSFYQIPNFKINYTEVLTHKPSVGAYRAPGAVQAAYVLESTIDSLTRKLGLDPLDVRLKNVSRTGDPMAHDELWPSMGLADVVAALQQHPAWQERDKARAAGRGVGVAVGGWPGGTEPTTASCLLDRDGTLQVKIASVDLSGTATGLGLIAAEAFGTSPDNVRVVTGDTTSGTFAGSTGGSKVTFMVGPSVIQAAQGARTQTLEIAAQEFEADAADLEIVNGHVQVKGVPDRTLSLQDIARKTMRFGGKYAPVHAHGRHAQNTPSCGFCAQLAEVEVDEETGQVKVHRLVLAQDVGKVINPLVMNGQIVGGAMQGLGWALYEAIHYDNEGQLLTGSWMDYNVPNFVQSVPDIEVVAVEIPSPHGPYGARGVGEPPIIATAAAVANAIADATGKRVTALPMTPPRVLAA